MTNSAVKSCQSDDYVDYLENYVKKLGLKSLAFMIPLILVGACLKIATFDDSAQAFLLPMDQESVAQRQFFQKLLNTSADLQKYRRFGNPFQDLDPVKSIELFEYKTVSIIQSSRNKSDIIPSDLLHHLSVLLKMKRLQVREEGIDWTFDDLCLKHSIPHEFTSQSLQASIPCVLITSLDCFWEGSKLLPRIPDLPDYMRKEVLESSEWSNTRPIDLFDRLTGNASVVVPNSLKIRSFLSESGMADGYLSRPCLDPLDPGCPKSAPNYQGKAPNVTDVLHHGCPSFAPNLARWPSEVLLGASATNIQSVIMLKSPFSLQSGKLLVELHSMAAADRVLNKWIAAFQGLVHDGSATCAVFAKWTIDRLVRASSRVSWTSSLGTVGLLVVLLGLCGVVCRGTVRQPHSISLIVGFALIACAILGGLGLCSLLGLPFNALTTRLLPFLLLGVGLDHVLHVAAFQNQLQTEKEVRPLRRFGPAILFGDSVTVAAFLLMAYVPLPAVRTFCFQAALVTLVRMVTVIFVYIPLVHLMHRMWRCRDASQTAPSCKACDPRRSCFQHPVQKPRPSLARCCRIGLLIGLCGALLIGPTIFALGHVQAALPLASIAPDGSPEQRFLSHFETDFGTYDFNSMVMGMADSYPRTILPPGTLVDLPMNQRLLRKADAEIRRDGRARLAGRGAFWLDTFRDWLLRLQEAFDQARLQGLITPNGTWHPSVSDQALVAMQLLVQTPSGPPDASQLLSKRLVQDGIIDPNGFYSYLVAWRFLDGLNYTSMSSRLHPDPLSHYTGGRYGLTEAKPSMEQLHPLLEPKSSWLFARFRRRSRRSPYFGSRQRRQFSPGRQMPPGVMQFVRVFPARPLQFVQTMYHGVRLTSAAEKVAFVARLIRLGRNLSNLGLPFDCSGDLIDRNRIFLQLLGHLRLLASLLMGLVVVFGLLLLPWSQFSLISVAINFLAGAAVVTSSMLILRETLNPVSTLFILLFSAVGARHGALIVCAMKSGQIRQALVTQAKLGVLPCICCLLEFLVVVSLAQPMLASLSPDLRVEKPAQVQAEIPVEAVVVHECIRSSSLSTINEESSFDTSTPPPPRALTGPTRWEAKNPQLLQDLLSPTMRMAKLEIHQHHHYYT